MTKTDKIIFWGTLALSLVLLLFSNVLFSPQGDETIVIEQNGKVYASYQKSALQTEKTIEIQTEYGYHRLVLSSDGVRVVETDCPDKLCMGEIQKAGDVLICPPNRLVIKICGAEEVDGVAY